MNKLLKVTLITAIMATSGMCSDRCQPYQAFPQRAPQQDSCGPMVKLALCAATGYVAYKMFCSDSNKPIKLDLGKLNPIEGGMITPEILFGDALRRGRINAEQYVLLENTFNMVNIEYPSDSTFTTSYPNHVKSIASEDLVLGVHDTEDNSTMYAYPAKVSNTSTDGKFNFEMLTKAGKEAITSSTSGGGFIATYKDAKLLSQLLDEWKV